MWPDLVSNPGPLAYGSGALPTGLHSPAGRSVMIKSILFSVSQGVITSNVLKAALKVKSQQMLLTFYFQCNFFKL